MAVTDLFAQRATLARSVRLLSEFRHEQSDPARFYGALADDTTAMVNDLWGSRAPGTLLDVGGGPGYFATAFTDAGWRYVGVEPDPGEMHAAGRAAAGGPGSFVRASGLALPFADASVDVCLSSNVAEHVAQPWQLGAEMLRVTRPGGLAILSYTVWLGPFGGHETGLWHYLGDAPPSGTPAGTGIGRRMTTGRRYSRCQRPRACAGPGPPVPWWPLFPATTRAGRGG